MSKVIIPKLIMLSGLPASGKTTRAKEIVKQGYKRVNKDLLRKMLHFDKWTPENERITYQVEKDIVHNLLMATNNVVVDDTNLSDSHLASWASIAMKCGADFEHIIIDTPMRECLIRNFYRDKEERVPDHVIISMAMQYRLNPSPDKGYIICDLDGTLCDITHREHFVNGKKDWDSFFDGIKDDKMSQEVFDLLEDFVKQEYSILFVSGRPERTRSETELWIKYHWGNGYYNLLMRPNGDFRPDHIVKNEILEKYIDKEKVYRIIDDRPNVIVKTWLSIFPKEKIIDVGKNDRFVDERTELDYWTDEEKKCQK